MQLDYDQQALQRLGEEAHVSASATLATKSVRVARLLALAGAAKLREWAAREYSNARGDHRRGAGLTYLYFFTTRGVYLTAPPARRQP